LRTSTRKHIKQLLAFEKGRIEKAYGDVRVALVYPNSYRLGMSNLGFQTVYGLINANPLGYCERSFLFEKEAVTLESGSTLSSFDIVAFSISFELDYPNIVELLRQAKIPLRAEDRTERHPLILAGGAAVMLNPEPVADFFDVFVIGEAETVLDELLSAVAESKGKSRPFLKERFAGLDGLYVPSFYQMGIDQNGRLREVTALGDAPYPIPRNLPPDIEQFATRSEILTPGTVFGERLLVEVSRGCPGGCRFCGARSIYHPPRWRSAGKVIQAVTDGLDAQKRVGLLGAAVGEHPEIQQICSALVEEGADISLSSVRAGKVTAAFAAALSKGGVRTLTIAPEGGSERIRKKVGKELSNRELIECAGIIRDSGISSVKLYFMVGLPGEERDDVEQIVQRVAEISSIIRVKVSVSPFVPKPWTEYQSAGMASLHDLRSTLSYLQSELRRMKGVNFSAASPRQSLIEGAFSRGNRAVGKWLEAGSIPPGEAERLARREIPHDEILPWDMLENPVHACRRSRSIKPEDTQPSPPPGEEESHLTFPGRNGQ
jgi:radical SAM superfamily enzyme YgiQ (UPF0313 family)